MIDNISSPAIEHTLDLCIKNIEVDDFPLPLPIPPGRENDKVCGKEDRLVAVKDGATCILPRDVYLAITKNGPTFIQKLFSPNSDVWQLEIFGFAFLFDPGKLIRINIGTDCSYIALFRCSGNDPRSHTIFNIVKEVPA